MKSFLFLFVLCLSIQLSAQNYNCLQPAVKNYFMNGKNYVRGIRIDSTVTSGTDVIYYPYKTQRISNYLIGTSHSFLGGSWLGGKVIRHADGTYLFDNLWDTVIIKTQATLGASWIFYNDTSHFNYTATVTAVDTMTVMGVLDSIKKISIFCDSIFYSYPNDPVNNFQIWLSKNHGFVQVFDLYTFPYHRPDTISYVSPHYYRNIRFIDYYLDVVLGNLGTCDLGCMDNAPDTVNSIFRLFSFYNPTKFQIYDFAVGDVYENHFVATSITVPYYYHLYTLDSVSNKTTGATTVGYSGPEHTMAINLNTTYPTTIWDTTRANGSYSGYGDTSHLISLLTMPEESTAGYLFHYFPKNVPFSGLCDSPAAYVIDQDYKATGFGYDGTVYRASYTSNTYSVGYGLTGKSNFNASSGIQQQQGYTFYKKGPDTCGTFVSAMKPHNVGITKLIDKNRLTISPNPASGYIGLASNKPLNSEIKISVYDITGKTVFRTNTVFQTACSINTTEWIGGLYIVVIQDETGIIQKEKIAIMH